MFTENSKNKRRKLDNLAITVKNWSFERYFESVVRRALLFPARQTKWCAFKGFARFYPASTLRKVLRKALMASTFVRRKTDGSRYLIPRLAWLFPGPCPPIEMGGILFRTLERGIWPGMAPYQVSRVLHLSYTAGFCLPRPLCAPLQS